MSYAFPIAPSLVVLGHEVLLLATSSVLGRAPGECLGLGAEGVSLDWEDLGMQGAV